jgi:hypothetical protein
MILPAAPAQRASAENNAIQDLAATANSAPADPEGQASQVIAHLASAPNTHPSTRDQEARELHHLKQRYMMRETISKQDFQGYLWELEQFSDAHPATEWKESIATEILAVESYFQKHQSLPQDTKLRRAMKKQTMIETVSLYPDTLLAFYLRRILAKNNGG